MQVILVRDVPKVGKKGELVNVSDGYGRNFLVARGYANIASEGALRAIDKERADKAAQLKREEEAAQALAVKLSADPVIIKANAGEGGKLFGSITSSDVAAAITKQHGIAIDKRIVKLETAVKQLGEYKVTLKLYTNVKATLTLKVEKD